MSPRPQIEYPESSARALAAALRERIDGEVRFDEGSRALYATDASNYRQVPIGVVIPRTVEEVIEAVALCREHDAPVLPRGGGTSLAGQCCNVAVVIDTSKYLHRILDLDPEKRRARVEPGCVLDDLRDAAELHHLTFGPDPSTHDHCVLGGMIGNNSCGVHSVMAGRTAENVLGLEILTYDGLRLHVGPTSEDDLERIVLQGGRRGEVYDRLRALRDRYADLVRARYPRIPRRVSGYNLDELLPENGFNVARALVGSEGTCAFVLSADLRLVHSPPGRVVVILGYPDVCAAGDHVPQVLAHGPIGLEGFDEMLTRYMRKKRMHQADLELLPEGGGWLLVELGGDDRREAADRARAMMDAIGRGKGAPTMKLVEDPAAQGRYWKIREAGLGATTQVPGEPLTWPGWEDAAVSPRRVGAYLREFRRLLDRFGYRCALYGHFGDGCVHCRIDFDLFSREGVAKYRAFAGEAADLVARYGGSLSGEHGDGQARAELLPKMFGPELVEAFREFKAVWDPDGRMNPGKLADPFAIDENLRLGAEYRPPEVETAFAFRADGGSFANAALRCVGVGKCRRHDDGVMCPSYMATREEMHSTRGRARLLFEMMQGDPLRGGWRSLAVREALDLCLACKGCKGECPVSVDMATYKAEFYAHYYKRRLRPREAYSMGLIYTWCRAASVAPGLANLLASAPAVGDLLKYAGAIAPERRLPRFARRTFRHWFARRRPPAASGREVILFPDTFNNHFHPEVLSAAVEVLEAAGCRVTVPGRALCCGRPLYAWGMLGRAKRQLRALCAALAPKVAAGVPVVGLEPACVTTFRDELPDLFPDDEAADALARRTFLLSEFLERHTDFAPPRLARRALVHAHCYHHAVIGLDDEKRLLDKLGLDYRLLDSGCCGMAGAFGFEREHYEVSMLAGERVLLPAVRAAAADELIVTDGFSCREQIEQATERRAMHVSEVIRDALHESGAKP